MKKIIVTASALFAAFAFQRQGFAQIREVQSVSGPVCERAPLPITFNANIENFSRTQAYWSMWFAYALEHKYADIQKLMIEVGVEDYRIVRHRMLGVQALVARVDGQVIVGFRGTRDIRDIIEDFRFAPASAKKIGLPGKVHSGFIDNFSRVWKETRRNAMDLGAAEAGVWLTGHSLGGALASLAAFKFSDEGVRVHSVYAFAQPNPGDAAFSAAYNARLGDRTFVFRLPRDIGGHIPPVAEAAEAFAGATPRFLDAIFRAWVKNINYRHVGSAWLLSLNGTMSPILDRVQADRDFYNRIRLENANGTLPTVLASNPSYLSQHEPGNYHCAMKTVWLSAQ
jgi:pimeloyl-ACP methyl ester carboxylesterase